MSIEESMNNLANAMNKYSDVITKHTAVLEAINANGVATVVPGTPGATTAAGTPEKAPKKPTKAEIAAAAAAAAPAATADEGDDWDNEEAEAPAKAITAEDVRDAILAVRDKGGEKANKDAAVEILKKLGVSRPTEIKPEQFEKAIALCKKALG